MQASITIYYKVLIIKLHSNEHTVRVYVTITFLLCACRTPVYRALARDADMHVMCWEKSRLYRKVPVWNLCYTTNMELLF